MTTVAQLFLLDSKIASPYISGIGMTCPDPKGDYTTPDGVVIPTGEGMNSDIGHSSLLYNEYPFQNCKKPEDREM